MKNYLDLLQDILANGIDKGDRTGTGTRSVFGRQLRFDLAAGFPLLTTKRVHLKSIIHELLWFLSGSTNTKYLTDNGVKIWSAWASADGSVGPSYGKQWRDFGGVDQIAQVVERVKTHPDCRRMVVSTWNPPEIPAMALAPCHILWQLYVTNGKLSLSMYQRSADVFLGVPFNIASYALLAMMIAKVTGYEFGELVVSLGDVHIYSNHMEQVREQLTRVPRAVRPQMLLVRRESIFDYNYEDFRLNGYDPHPAIKAPVAV